MPSQKSDVTFEERIGGSKAIHDYAGSKKLQVQVKHK